MYPNLCNNFVDVVTGGICPYGSHSRHHMWLHSCDKRRHENIAIILSHKIIDYKRLCSKIMEIKSL